MPYCSRPYKSHCQLHPAPCISDYLCWARSAGVGQPKACKIEVTWLLIRVQTPAGICENFLPRASTWRRPRVHWRQKWSLTLTQSRDRMKMAGFPERRVRGPGQKAAGTVAGTHFTVQGRSPHLCECYLHANLLHSNTRTGEHRVSFVLISS